MVQSRFRRIALQTSILDEQRHFYVETLSFPLESQGEGGFAVRAGDSLLEFRRAATGGPFLYHFAFDIPGNQIHEALDWTRARVPVVEKESKGSHIYRFESWNAHAFYFLDPQGNILEFIARHNQLSTAQCPFGPSSIVRISEIGLATDDVAVTSRVLIDRLGLDCYPDSTLPPDSEFQAVGDESGMFILARRGRNWLGSGQIAQPFPAEVVMSSNATFEVTDTMCRVTEK